MPIPHTCALLRLFSGSKKQQPSCKSFLTLTAFNALACCQ